MFCYPLLDFFSILSFNILFNFFLILVLIFFHLFFIQDLIFIVLIAIYFDFIFFMIENFSLLLFHVRLLQGNLGLMT